MTARPRERGIALLLVLWIFMMLGVLALDFARYMRDDAMAAVNFADETHGYYLALAGMNRALWERKCAQARAKLKGGAQAIIPLSPTATSSVPAIAEAERRRQGEMAGRGVVPGSMVTDPDDDLIVKPDGGWHDGDFANGRWSVRMQDQGGRIPLNGLRPDNPEHEAFLKYVITNIMRGGNRTKGVDVHGEKAIDTVVDSILDWRDHDDKNTRPNGAESDWYRKNGFPYRPANGQFESPEELLRVRGVTPALFYGSEGTPGLRDIFSVRRGHYRDENARKVNIRSVTPAVLLALVGDQDTVDDLIAKRDDPNGSQPILPLVQGLLTTNSGGLKADDFVADYEPEVVMVEAHGDIASERNQSRIAALVDVGGGDVLILDWWDRAPWDGRLPGLPDAPEANG